MFYFIVRGESEPTHTILLDTNLQLYSRESGRCSGSASSKELSVMVKCSIICTTNTVAIGHMGLLSICNTASVTKEMNFLFYSFPLIKT